MAEYKLNKSELTRLNRELNIFNQYLPVLKLKKEQLQSEHGHLKRAYLEQKEKFEGKLSHLSRFAPLLAEPLPFDLTAIARPERTVISERIIAGLRVPNLEAVHFPKRMPPRFGTPPWVSRLLPQLRDLAEEQVRTTILEKQFRAVDRELRKTTQKVNLFEKVLVPRTHEAIRRIRITLSDQEVAAVCRAKIAKGKKMRIEEVPL